MKKNLIALIVMASLMRSASAPAASPAPAAAPDSGRAKEAVRVTPDSTSVADSTAVPDSSLVFRVEIGNRMFPDWKEEQKIHLATPFRLGDSENWAVAPAFLPDFRIVDGKFVSASRAWKNPAIHIVVHNDSTAFDSTWAFRDFPPHFSQRSFFTFKLLEILAPGGTGNAR